MRKHKRGWRYAPIVFEARIRGSDRLTRAEVERDTCLYAIERLGRQSFLFADHREVPLDDNERIARINHDYIISFRMKVR